MDGWTIVNVLRKDPRAKYFFRGVYPSDKLVFATVDTRQPSAFVVNFDSSEEPGSHWVVCWFSAKHGIAEYFDSYGLPPPKPIDTFLRKHSQFYRYNHRTLQSLLSKTCGYYCIYYVMKKARGQTLSRVLMPFHPYNYAQNDRQIVLWTHPHLTRSHSVVREHLPST